MSRLNLCFQQCRDKGEKALIVYLTAGDPSPAQTVKIVCALEAAGVDVIELGIPFSDPLADGVSIQAAAQRALDNGMTVAGTLDLVREIRQVSEIPLVLMTYFNPTLQYGLEKFAAEAVRAGADGVIQTDLTPEEAAEWIQAGRSHQLDTIFLLAPTSTDPRIQVVSCLTTGFVYCISRTGVTGRHDDLPLEAHALLQRTRRHIEVPICVGFGISTPEQVRHMATIADGVIVGSAIIDIIERWGDSSATAQKVGEYAALLKAATRSDKHACAACVKE